MKLYLFKSAVFILAFLIALEAIGQTDDIFGKNPFEVKPVSPNAAAICAYGNIPVSNYTGVASVEIPICNINLEGKNFPISLSYSTTGIKVGQEASDVGLGWTLNTGGIARDIKGMDDLDPDYGYCWNATPYNLVEKLKHTHNISGQSEYAAELRQATSSKADFEPDIMHVNLNGNGGQFIFPQFSGAELETIKRTNLIDSVVWSRHEGNMKVICKTDGAFDALFHKIQPTWKIIDGDGYIYAFNDIEKTYPFSFTDSSPLTLRGMTAEYIFNRISSTPDCPTEDEILSSYNVTAWMPTEIASPKGLTIRFIYGDEDIATVPQRSDMEFYKSDLKGHPYDVRHSQYTFSFAWIKRKVLKEIIYPDGRIIFKRTRRYDIAPYRTKELPTLISEIDVEDDNRQYIKRYVLSYDYDRNIKPNTTDIQSRAYLRSVSAPEGLYKFTYDQTRLPEKCSASYDNLGFYNMQPENETVRYAPDVYLNRGLIAGRKQIIDETGSKAGSLEKVSYPTGLETQFEYEPRYSLGYDGSEMTFLYDTIRTVVAELEDSLTIDGVTQDKNYTKEFYIGEDGDYLLDCVTYRIKNGNNSTYKNYSGVFFNTLVEWYNSSTRKWETLPKNNYGEDVFNIYITQTEDNINKFKVVERSERAHLPKGRYMLQASPEAPCPQYFRAAISKETIVVDTMSFRGTYPKDRLGGIRVKRISNFYDGKKLSETEYRYSEGVVMEPNAKFTAFLHRSDPGFGKEFLIDHQNFGTILVRCSKPYTPFSNSAQGYEIGYKHVDVVSYDNDTVSAFTSYTYHSERDCEDSVSTLNADYLGGSSLEIPETYKMPDALNGRLERAVYYDGKKNVLKVEDYDYKGKYMGHIKGIHVSTPIPWLADEVDPAFLFYVSTGGDVDDRIEKMWSHPCQMSATTYTIPTSFKLGSVLHTIRTHTARGDITEKELTGYSDNNDLPKFKKTYTSEGDSIETNMRYCTDSPNSQGALLDANMKNTVYEVMETLNGKVTRATLTDYEYRGQNIVPVRSYSTNNISSFPKSELRNHYVLDYEATRYDDYGNPLEVVGRDGLHTAYIWSYGYRYPIAIIKNIAYDRLCNAISLKNYGEANVPDMTRIDALRNTLPESLILSMTYDGWGNITSLTDEYGSKYFYEYDSQGRLSKIYDQEHNIKQEFRYNYQSK